MAKLEGKGCRPPADRADPIADWAAGHHELVDVGLSGSDAAPVRHLGQRRFSVQCKSSKSCFFAFLMIALNAAMSWVR